MLFDPNFYRDEQQPVRMEKPPVFIKPRRDPQLLVITTVGILIAFILFVYMAT